MAPFSLPEPVVNQFLIQQIILQYYKGGGIHLTLHPFV